MDRARKKRKTEGMREPRHVKLGTEESVIQSNLGQHAKCNVHMMKSG
jgi:hypothetical protein